MKQVNSLQEYYDLINEAKKKGRLFTNCYLFADSIERYITLQRLFYEVVESGVIFFCDEEQFYQMYYHVDSNVPFVITKKDKPVLAQNVFMEGKKKENMALVQKSLENSGFKLADTMKHGIFIGEENIPKIKRGLRGIDRIFEKEGLVFAPLRRDQIPEMLAFQKTIDEIPFYQFPYFTDDEYMEEAAAERLCCVMDKTGRIIAARHLIVNGKKAYGWVGIEEQYKGTYGVAIKFLCNALDYIAANDVKMCSWVDEKNVPSLQYHDRLGTQWTGHLEEEWLLEKQE